jgi:hypothetical protein
MKTVYAWGLQPLISFHDGGFDVVNINFDPQVRQAIQINITIILLWCSGCYHVTKYR